MSSSGDVVDGRFELIARIGGGGMGTVWRARDTVLHREVALKAVRQDAQASDTTRERVLREARALARVSGPHVVTVHQVIEAEPHPWIVMELVSGVSLEHRIAERLLSPMEAAGIGRQVLAALRAAHGAGILHRDVKPANILIRPDGTVVLVDFGIAALQGLPGDLTALTATGELVGSPEYMAPERIRGNDTDPASDLWSLGLVLYVGVEGVRPLRRATTLATLAAVLDEPIPSPVRVGPLTPVLQALLARDPSVRPNALQLDEMLAQVEAGTVPQWNQMTVTATRPPMPTRPPSPHVVSASNPDAAPVIPSPTQPDVPRPGSSGRDRRTTVILLAVTVAAVAVAAVVLGLHLSGPDLRGTPQGSKKTSGSTATVKVSSQPTTSPSSPPPATPSKSATPTKPAVSNPPSDGHWIAQLASEPVSSGTAVRDTRLTNVRASVPEARYLYSTDYASLRPGYWVIYAPGPFADGRTALDYCAKNGLITSHSCIGRYLSDDRDDFGFQCQPPAHAPKGRCTHDT